MNELEELEWTNDEADQIRALAREAAPPPDLIARIERRLRAEKHSRPRSSWRLLAALLAGLVCFAAGFVAARETATTPSPDFVLLLRNSGAGASPERVAEYGRWARDAATRGEVVDGEKLSGAAVLLTAVAADRTELGAGEIGGFFLIRASGVDEAVRIARDSPHLRYGGTIEIRELERGR